MATCTGVTSPASIPLPDETIGGGFELPDFTPPQGCQFVGNMAWDIEIEHWVFDPSSFSSEAITFLNTTLPYLNSSNPMP